MELNFRLLRADEIDCKVKTVSDKGCQLLLYKDARCDMNILDETVGKFGWQRDHKELKGNMYCGVGILEIDRNEWMWKWDCGAESNTEAEKGEASDSFKRACFNWGIGRRELYSAPFIWIPAEKCKLDRKGDKYVCYDKFEVTKIEYKDNGEILKLQICNKKTCVSVFNLGYSDYATPSAAEQKAPVKIDPVNVVNCDDCGAPIAPYKGKSAKELEIYSLVHYKRKLCHKCIINADKMLHGDT